MLLMLSGSYLNFFSSAAIKPENKTLPVGLPVTAGVSVGKIADLGENGATLVKFEHVLGALSSDWHFMNLRLRHGKPFTGFSIF